jgi:hypothetical protein
MIPALAGCNGALCREAERFLLDVPWDGYERVVVRTGNGHVELLSGGGDDIRISGVKRAGGLTWKEARENLDRLTIIAQPDQADPTTFRIELKVPPELCNKGPGASFDVRVPEACAADIATGNGRVRVCGLKGSAQVHSSNGRIIVQDVDGSVGAGTSNGSIVVSSVAGDCQLKTSNGRIEVQDVDGSVSAATSNGSIFVRATPPPEGYAVLQTSNGSIRALLPPNMRGRLSLCTGHGRVSTDLEGVTLADPRWSKDSMEAEINGGGKGKVVARTSNGSITLECR